jgi:hypothetical protein
MSERYLIQHLDGRVDITDNATCPEGATLRRITAGYGETSGSYVLSQAPFEHPDPCPVLLFLHSASDADKAQLRQLLDDHRYQDAAVIPGLAAHGWVDDMGYLTLDGEQALQSA